jgi:YfiH family protein
MLLQCLVHSRGPVYYVSPLLRDAGIPHAFSTRLGGVSPPPFDSLNLGNPGGEIQDDRARIFENYRLLEEAAGLRGRERCWLHQVHGNAVARIGCSESHDSAGKGDGLVSDDPARILSVRTADCCPVLLATEDGRRVAAVHAGWRGAVAGVCVSALEQLLKWRLDEGQWIAPQKVLAAIGPCIGVEAFEVGPEVLLEFERAFGSEAPIQRGASGKGCADIRAALRLQLLRAGVLERNIDTSERCTVRDRDEFFSHRRENGVTGRMAAVIGAKDS